MQIIKDTPRKIIRYLMFVKKNNISLPSPIIGEEEDLAVIEYFEGLDDFTCWDDFETRWDIGMKGDVVAITNRKEKWFLFDNEKHEIVFRPSNYWDKESSRLGVSTMTVTESERNLRGLTRDEFYETFLN